MLKFSDYPFLPLKTKWKTEQFALVGCKTVFWTAQVKHLNFIFRDPIHTVIPWSLFPMSYNVLYGRSVIDPIFRGLITEILKKQNYDMVI